MVAVFFVGLHCKAYLQTFGKYNIFGAKKNMDILRLKEILFD